MKIQIRHLWLSGGLALVALTLIIPLLLLLPPTDTIKTNYPEHYFIPNNSNFEYQGRNQCAGFASAYLLRTLKIKIKGETAYHQIPLKFPNGYVLPHGIPLYFKTHNQKLKMVTGSLPTLKTRLNQGNPIILLVKAGEGLHYITLVGYDKTTLYFFDSLRNSKTTKKHNRALTNTELETLWQIEIPLFKNVYFFIQ